MVQQILLRIQSCVVVNKHVDKLSQFLSRKDVAAIDRSTKMTTQILLYLAWLRNYRQKIPKQEAPQPDSSYYYYGSVCKAYYTIHHQGIRLSLGAFRTSPVESLSVEAHEESLYRRRERLIAICNIAEKHPKCYTHFWITNQRPCRWGKYKYW